MREREGERETGRERERERERERDFILNEFGSLRLDWHCFFVTGQTTLLDKVLFSWLVNRFNCA